MKFLAYTMGCATIGWAFIGVSVVAALLVVDGYKDNK